jgi:hypothetical protein
MEVVGRKREMVSLLLHVRYVVNLQPISEIMIYFQKRRMHMVLLSLHFLKKVERIMSLMVINSI